MKKVKTIKGYVIKEYNTKEQEERNGYKYGIFFKDNQDNIECADWETEKLQELIDWID